MNCTRQINDQEFFDRAKTSINTKLLFSKHVLECFGRRVHRERQNSDSSTATCQTSPPDFK